MTLPQGRTGLSARQMAVWSTFREPTLCRPVDREFMRSVLLDLPPIMPTTACYQRNYGERYSMFSSKDVIGYQLGGAVKAHDERDGVYH